MCDEKPNSFDLHIFCAYATRTTTEASEANGAINGSTYSGKTLASLRGTSLTIPKQAVSVCNAQTRTLAA